MLFWMGIEGPAGMPAAIVEKLNAAIRAAVATPTMLEQLANAGAEPYLTSPAEFKALRQQDIIKLGKVVKEMGLRPE